MASSTSLLAVVSSTADLLRASRVAEATSSLSLTTILAGHTGREPRFFPCTSPIPALLPVDAVTGTERLIELLRGLEAEVQSRNPLAILAWGDGLAVLAASWIAQDSGLPFIHIDAGERLYRRDAAEVARVVADHGATLALTATDRARRHLLREGFHPDRVRFVGDLLRDLAPAPKPRAGIYLHLEDTPAFEVEEHLSEQTYAASIDEAAWLVTDSDEAIRQAALRGIPSAALRPTRWAELVECGAVIEGDTVPPGEPPSIPIDLFGEPGVAERTATAITEFLDRPRGGWHAFGTFEEIPRPIPSVTSYRAYRKLIRDLKTAGYRFLSFPQAFEAVEKDEPFVLMRHDIDFDLPLARAMAEVEAEEGIASTYFYMVRTEHYHVFSAEGSQEIRRTLDLGHHLGLHFDCASYDADMLPTALAEACGREAEMLETWFGHQVEIVSYHRPDRRILTGDPAYSAPRPHTYMPFFQERMQYVSDSQGLWRHGHPTDSPAFHERRPLHILVHPVWWTEAGLAPYETLVRFIESKSERLARSLAANCKPFRRGWLANLTYPD